MRKPLLYFSSIILLLWSAPAFAASNDTLFTLPDTVCVGNEISPGNIVNGANTYSWSFCPPQMAVPPRGENIGNIYRTDGTNGLTMVKDENGKYFAFALNKLGNMVRLFFRNGIESEPVVTAYGTLDGAMPIDPSGIQVIRDHGVWQVLIVGGRVAANTRMIRLTFGNGLRKEITQTTILGNLAGVLNRPRELIVVNDSNRYVAYTFNDGKELIRINYDSTLTSMPTATNLGNVANAFSSASAINAIKEIDNWYLHVTDRDNNSLVKLAFGNSLNNIPFATTYGNVGGRFNAPNGIAITPNCKDYYGYVLNNNGSSLTAVRWDASIADTPNMALNLGNSGDMVQPQNMTQFQSENGGLYLFVANNDSSITRLSFDPCTASTYPGSDERTPKPFAYTTAGTYTVFLTVDQGLASVRTYCRQIVVTAAPDLLVSNDTLICLGDTVDISALFNAAEGSLRWNTKYNISDTTSQTVKVYPRYTTGYALQVNFGRNCILRDTVNVAVSKIGADAGGDRTIADGSMTTLGGPGTTLGDNFTYQWTPGDYITGSLATDITTAKPDQDITYYLSVSNSDGCKAIDSVLVNVSCAEVNLPNAFVPGSKNKETNSFGIKNVQLVKLNYFRIYDRWGTLVFSTTNPLQRWDGNYKGTNAAMGVYVYEIDAFCNAGNRVRKTGNVTLLR